MKPDAQVEEAGVRVGVGHGRDRRCKSGKLREQRLERALGIDELARVKDALMPLGLEADDAERGAHGRGVEFFEHQVIKATLQQIRFGEGASEFELDHAATRIARPAQQRIGAADELNAVGPVRVR